jgi:rSAM/selenodomain-associated transferase 1
MALAMVEPVEIAILAKAPVPGHAKTRLAAALGAEGAALLQARMIERTVETAKAAGTGRITLWATPDEQHPLFQMIGTTQGIKAVRQPEGDLGARMHAAVKSATGPVLVIGTDCPALKLAHLRTAADVLRDGFDSVVIPVEDGGYALIGMRRADHGLFVGMPWGTASVMRETRRRMLYLRYSWREPARLWDVDVPEDLERLKREGLSTLLK